MALVPVALHISSTIAGHWTKPSKQNAVIRKVYIGLLIAVLILPSLGLASVGGFIEWFSAKNSSEAYFRWHCIFVSGNSAYFVNYISSMALIGTANELLRFSDLILYGLLVISARSSAERTAIRESMVDDFPFGVHYAWTLLVFTVTICYSVSSPIITVIGLVSLVMKHLADRYNLFFVYGPSKIDISIHSNAISFFIVGVGLLQVHILLFIVLRAELFRPINIFAAVALVVTVVIFIGRMFCGMIIPM